MVTIPYDAATYLDSEDMIQAYLADAFEEGDLQGITAALGNVARARSMGVLADKTNLSRESLYKSLSKGGNPSFATVLKVMTALGLQLTVQPIKKHADAA